MFYKNLKNLCFKRDISVSKIAMNLKISTTTVVGWKRSAEPRAALLKKTAGHFEVSTDEVMSETDPENPIIECLPIKY